ncbi:MAG: mitochondrial fission ELM1 family protein [Planctomycetaceae bacterium]
MGAVHKAIVEHGDGAAAASRSSVTSPPAIWPRLASETLDPPLPAQACSWTLTEGAAGMLSQVTGLAQAIGFPATHHQVVMRWPFSTMWPGFLPPWSGIFADRSLLDPSSPPRVVVSCGRLGSAASLALKRRFKSRVFTVHIQDPKLPTHWFDLIVAPSHDGLRGANVVHSLGAVHHVTAARLQVARDAGPTAEMHKLTAPFVGVILGGPNRYYGYTPSDIQCLISRLRAVVSKHQVQLALVPSRRTPPVVLTEINAAFGREHFVWDGRGTNPYLSVLALASHLIVTGDSVSMVSEAAATCKPVHVFHLTEQRTARRFRKFHQSFVNAGITRPFQGRLENWSYASPDRTGLIAQLIHEHLR